ncbi:MAG TPA: folylpolyglutamate synthase/dihydrofolate synthase family protein [Jiangellaceae bacterium]|nr:folylpolyglutamate synthase/dihydrofolate synthase family protein [Jiangellaceae bacterium]
MSSEALRDVEVELATRWPESKIEPSIGRIRDLADLLGNPQQAYPVIQISGTNGKTSTARMIDELLRELGLRTGRFTSPHLESVTERICLDGEPVAADRFAAAYRELAPYLQLVDRRHEIRLSYFEVLVALAYSIFADAPVDVAVVEVGMGGTWDATNVADAKVAVVTPIALDHTDYLGDTLAEIAAEKAGIIKPDGFAVIARQPAEAADLVRRRIGEVGAPAAWEGVDFAVRDRQLAVGGQLLSLRGLTGQYDEIALPLHGEYQAGNAACAVAAVEAFVGGGREPLDPDAVRDALGRVGSPGRLEVVRRSPTILVDAAHNPAGTLALVQAVQEEFSFTRLVGVVAVLGDKDVRGMLEELEPILETVVVTENSSPRRLPVDELGPLADQVFGPERVVRARQLPDAIDAAVGLVEEEAILGGAGVLVTGSVVTAGDARHLLGGPR